MLEKHKDGVAVRLFSSYKSALHQAHSAHCLWQLPLCTEKSTLVSIPVGMVTSAGKREAGWCERRQKALWSQQILWAPRCAGRARLSPPWGRVTWGTVLPAEATSGGLTKCQETAGKTAGHVTQWWGRERRRSGHWARDIWSVPGGWDWDINQGGKEKEAKPRWEPRGQRGDRRRQGKVQGVLQGCGRWDREEGLWTLRRPTGSCKPFPQEPVRPAWGDGLERNREGSETSQEALVISSAHCALKTCQVLCRGFSTFYLT